MLWNILQLAFRDIRRNVLRSFLTVLGIVIGVAAVIVMVILGNGATQQVTNEIESLGSDLLIIRPGQREAPASLVGVKPFDMEDVSVLRNEISGLGPVAPATQMSMTAVVGNKNWTTNATGSDNQYLRVRNWRIEIGREFTRSELRVGKAVCILGAAVRRELFGKQDPTGKRIRLRKMSCEVIGLLEAKGQSSVGLDQDDLVLMPLRTLQRRMTDSQNVGMIYASVREGESVDRIKKDIERLFRERRNIAPWQQDDFVVTDMREIAGMLTSITKILTALLGAIASISLLVGGIGIMNIMLVSVTERTREIGIRLAIGAQEKDVLTQFLVEAMVLSSLGGLIGILLALSTSLWLTHVMHIPFIFDGKTVVFAFVFSAAVGIIFGYMPARRAARMDPIDALRHE